MVCAESWVLSMDADSAPEDVENTFAIWYQAEYGGLLRTLVLAIGDTEVATEAAAEAFVRALQDWDRVSMMGSPTGWTYTVALNIAHRAFRRARLEALLLRRRTSPPPVREDALEVWDAVQRLPLRQRTAVALHYLSDLSQRDVAAVMGIAEGTVAATLSEARKRLKVTLGAPVGKDVMEHG
jgi:RNA polymerase sigma-70 factor (ECF subfamily)